jgi:purine-binding chemotaxis protein CheW
MSAASIGIEAPPYLTFFVADEAYAVAVRQVQEVIEHGTVTRVPSTPAWIRGVINLRGSVIPIVDLGVKFGLEAGAVTHRTCIVLVEIALNGLSTVMGVVADSVSQVVELAATDIEPPPAFGTSVRVDFLLGMTRLEGRLILLLDIDRVLSTDELLAAQRAAEPAADDTGPGIEGS